MKKFKSLVLFISITAMLVLCFALSASAETEWKTTILNENVVYSFEDNSGTMIVKAVDDTQKAVIDDAFGLGPMNNSKDIFDSSDYDYSIDNEVYLIDFPHVMPDVKKTKTLIIDESIDELKNFCFDHFDSVEVIILPQNIIKIPDGAFYKLENLTTVVFSGETTSIGEYAFYGCTGLKSLYIPEKVKSIGEGAFYGCTGLKNLYISETIQTIGDYAFYGCDSDYINVPKSVKNIGKDLFVAENPKVYCNGNPTSDSYTIRCDFEPQQCVSGIQVYNYDKSKKTYKKLTTIKSDVSTPDFEGQVFKYTLNNLDADKVYTLAFKAWYTVGGNTVWSNYSELYEFSINPQVISSVEATASSTDAITVKWSEAIGATNYNVYRYEAGKWKHVDTVSNGTAYKFKNLKDGTTYTFAVRPWRLVQTDKYTGKKVYAKTYTKVTSATKPKTPTARVATTAKGRATIAWNDVAGETGYQVWYSTNASSGYKKIANYKADTTKIYKTGLESGKTYYFRVRAYSKVGNTYIYSAFSGVKSLKIK